MTDKEKLYRIQELVNRRWGNGTKLTDVDSDLLLDIAEVINDD